jgi:predicted ArsR family transcriptional regulator
MGEEKNLDTLLKELEAEMGKDKLEELIDKLWDRMLAEWK